MEREGVFPEHLAELYEIGPSWLERKLLEFRSVFLLTPFAPALPSTRMTTVCCHACMKTITLDDDAYQRLKSWKRGEKDSFSKVVKRVVPKRGTLSALKDFVDANETAKLPGNQDLEDAVGERPTKKTDPWAS